jgi:hypothetical protein
MTASFNRATGKQPQAGMKSDGPMVLQLLRHPGDGRLQLLGDEQSMDLMRTFLAEMREQEFKEGQAFGAHLAETWFLNITLAEILPERRLKASRRKAKRAMLAAAKETKEAVDSCIRRVRID